MTFRSVLKRTVQAVALILAWPFAFCSFFGRVGFVFEIFAHLFALFPGVIGNFFRSAYYRLTLSDCSIDTVIGFGTYFSRRHVVVRPYVSIGSYCVIGQAEIGARTQIASNVQIPGGGSHARDAAGRLSGPEDNPIKFIKIGSDCWIGTSAIVLADIGEQSTIGAGSVVVKPIPPRVVALGVPAKPVKSSFGKNAAPSSFGKNRPESVAEEKGWTAAP